MSQGDAQDSGFVEAELIAPAEEPSAELLTAELIAAPPKKPRRRGAWLFTAAGNIAIVATVAVITIAALGFDLWLGRAADHAAIMDAEYDSMLREKERLEDQDGPDPRFHGRLATLALRGVDYEAFRDEPLWRIHRGTFIVRLGLLALSLWGTVLVFRRRESARWWLLLSSVALSVLSGVESYVQWRELPAFSAEFVRDWLASYRRVEEAIDYRAQISLAPGLEPSKVRAIAWGWFLATSLYWQGVALYCARGIMKSPASAKPQKEGSAS